MDTAVVGEVIRESGPIGGMLLLGFLFVRDRLIKLEAKFDAMLAQLAKHEKQLDEQSRRILHIEKSTTTQPIVLEGGAT